MYYMCDIMRKDICKIFFNNLENICIILINSLNIFKLIYLYIDIILYYFLIIEYV